MANFNAKWKVVKGENVEAYCDKLGVDDAQREYVKRFFTLDVVDELKVDDAQLVRTTFIGGEKKRETTIKFNVEQDVQKTLAQNITVKGTFKKESDNKITGVEVGAKHSGTIESIVDGNTLRHNTTIDGVTATIVYEKV